MTASEDENFLKTGFHKRSHSYGSENEIHPEDIHYKGSHNERKTTTTSRRNLSLQFNKPTSSSISRRKNYYSDRRKQKAIKLTRHGVIGRTYQYCLGIYYSTSTINKILRFSIGLWMIVQGIFLISNYRNTKYFTDDYYITLASEGRFRDYLRRKMPELTQGEIRNIRKRRRDAAKRALGPGGEHFRAHSRTSKKGKKDPIPPGCEYSKWQNQTFPNCNTLHEYDLKINLDTTRFELKFPDFNDESQGNDFNEIEYAHYLGSGLWRNVWKLKSASDTMPAVFKILKMEHEIDERNFDRHRRDAVVMERFTSNPNIVSIYGFCGNSILTQYVGRGLDEFIFDAQKPGRDTNVLSTLMKSNTDRKPAIVNSVFSRRDPKGRIKLALEVARGLAAIHQLDSGDLSIIHADIEAKQFLIDETNGKIVLNDFNRCRFVPHNTTTQKACPITIATAPGNYRSPEEYLKRTLTEKLDIFSLGHVLYTILTGHKPFYNIPQSMKELVMHRQKPTIDLGIITDDADKLLSDIIDRAYSFDAAERINITDIVSQLESFLDENL